MMFSSKIQQVVRPLCLIFFISIFLFASSSLSADPANPEAVYNTDVPTLIVKNIPFNITIEGANLQDKVGLLINDKNVPDLKIEQNDTGIIITGIEVHETGTVKVDVMINDHNTGSVEARSIHGILTILPPILAILLALVFRQVIIALVTGVWLGATFLAGYNPLTGLFDTITHYIKHSLTDPDRAAILLFTTLLGGMIGVISRSGGTLGVVKKLQKFARTPRRAQLATWMMGLFIFFDDYSNTLIVGNTMRSISDKLKISREKLAYIVDSTAAPVTSIAVITTWVGFQISLISNSFQSLDLKYSPFITFVQSVPYQFYSLLALVFVFTIAFSGRDWGPMYKAELRARNEGKVTADDAIPMADFSPDTITPPEGTPLRWVNAVVPILFVIIGTFAGLIIDGYSKLKATGTDFSKVSFFSSLKDIFSAADSFHILMIVSFVGCVITVLLVVAQKILNLAQSMDALVWGLKSMLMAVIILILAGSIGDICADLKTADYISSILHGNISIHLLPAATFLVAAFISFSTGTSWGTMSILTPLVIPLTFKMGQTLMMSEGDIFKILLLSIASIMGGAVFGDHSSPISDTTIMSSIASASDHIHHVKTQFPYAALVASVSLFICLIPATYFGISPVIPIVTSIILLALFVKFVGKKTD